MAKVTQTVQINARMDKVFGFVADPQRATTFVPGLNRISNLSSPEPKTGRKWDWEFNWFGLTLSGNTECTRYDPNTVYQFKTLTGARSTWTYRCEPRGQHTQVTLEVEYEVPSALLTRVTTRAILEKMNQNRAAEAVANLKALLEP